MKIGGNEELVNKIDRDNEKMKLVTINFFVYGETLQELNKHKKELQCDWNLFTCLLHKNGIHTENREIIKNIFSTHFKIEINFMKLGYVLNKLFKSL